MIRPSLRRRCLPSARLPDARTPNSSRAFSSRRSGRDIDRRLADVELYYTSRNRQLADEIDSLR